jgi:hypothetical protein
MGSDCLIVEQLVISKGVSAKTTLANIVDVILQIEFRTATVMHLHSTRAKP